MRTEIDRDPDDLERAMVEAAKSDPTGMLDAMTYALTREQP